MSLIYIIRHGQASFGTENYDRLSDLGVHQSELLGEYFKTTGVTFDRIYSGSLNRQIATFRVVMERMQSNPWFEQPIILPEFNETDSFTNLLKLVAALAAEDPEIAESVESMNTDPHAFKKLYAKVVQRWGATKTSDDYFTSWKEVGKRVRAGLDRVRAENGPGKRVAVFTSGGPIAATVQIVLDLADAYAMNLPRLIRNTAVSTFLYDEKRLSLSTYNSIAHLELHNDPTLISFI